MVLHAHGRVFPTRVGSRRRRARGRLRACPAGSSFWPSCEAPCRAADSVRLRRRAFRLSTFPVAQRAVRGVVTWRTCDSAARVRPCAAQIKSRDRRAILGPARHGPHEKKLLERKIAVKNIAFGDAVGAFEVE